MTWQLFRCYQYKKQILFASVVNGWSVLFLHFKACKSLKLLYKIGPSVNLLLKC